MKVTRRGLEMTRQRPNERFPDFLARWPKLPKWSISPPRKGKSADNGNMSRQYHDSFYFQAMPIYDSLMEPLVLKWYPQCDSHGSQVKKADQKRKEDSRPGSQKQEQRSQCLVGKPKTPRTWTSFGITLSRALEKLKKNGVLTPLRPSPPPDPIPSLNLTLEVMLPKENTEKKQIRGKLTLRVPFLLLKKLGIPLLPQLEEPTATSCRATLFHSQFIQPSP